MLPDLNLIAMKFGSNDEIDLKHSPSDKKKSIVRLKKYIYLNKNT